MYHREHWQALILRAAAWWLTYRWDLEQRREAEWAEKEDMARIRWAKALHED